MKTKGRQFAAFDIDGTVFRSSLLIELVEGLIQHGVFPKGVDEGYRTHEKAWKSREGHYEDYANAVVRVFEDNLKGVHYADFADVSEAVVERLQNHTYRYTRNLIQGLKKRGYYLLAISQSPKTVVEAFGKRLGFDKVYGRIYELGPEDRFTSGITNIHLIENKANIVRRVIENEGLTSDGSYGVGDTEGDIPMLELVAQPIAFNPNATLYRHAKRMGWDVVVERKDVIYNL